MIIQTGIKQKLEAELLESKSVWIATAMISYNGWKFIQKNLSKEVEQHFLIGIDLATEPKVFEDSENITNQLRDMRPVLINFENTDPHEAARIVDFVSGATFALDGKLEKVGKDIFMCVPVNISIDHNEKANMADLNSQFTWEQPKA